MSNKTELQANNVELQEILDSVNALPDVGGNITYNTIYIGATTPTSDIGVDGDIYIVRS